jgi:aryl-alcohol dehydrogenase-like predicted oxidoreductase
MEYRNFGRTGVKVSPFCLGTMNFGGPTSEAESIAIIEKAVGRGINFIDCANVYNKGESELITGKALKKLGGRERIFLATKFYNAMGDDPNARGVSRFHLMQACEDSLRRLAVDHIDLYQIHRPTFDLPQDETLRALDDLVHAGKVRYIGTSTYPAWKVMEGLATSERLGLNRFVSEQPPYNLLDRRIENELIPLAQTHGLAIIPWSPLAGGMLSGKYAPGGAAPDGTRGASGMKILVERFVEKAKAVAALLKTYAEGRGLSAAQLAYLWVKDQPGVTAPIIGPRTMEQFEIALAMMEKKLSVEDAAFCDSLVPPGSAVADFLNTSGWSRQRLQ